MNNSSGTIWQLMPPFGGNNILEAQTFIFSSGPPPVFALRNDLVDAFDAGDLRRIIGLELLPMANKYKENGNTGSSVEYSILFRLEELYLIRVEAKAQLGDLQGSKTDLNTIRNRAGLANTTALTQQELLTAVLEERRKEFFTELGHRWFDLKRTGNADAVLNIKKPGWDVKDLLWPLPENEFLLLWSELRASGMSDDGTWVYYTVLHKESDTVYLHHSKKGLHFFYPRAHSASFSPHSKWFGFMEKDSLLRD